MNTNYYQQPTFYCQTPTFQKQRSEIKLIPKEIAGVIDTSAFHCGNIENRHRSINYKLHIIRHL